MVQYLGNLNARISAEQTINLAMSQLVLKMVYRVVLRLEIELTFPVPKSVATFYVCKISHSSSIFLYLLPWWCFIG